MKDLKNAQLWWRGLSNEAKVKIYWDYMEAVHWNEKSEDVLE